MAHTRMRALSARELGRALGEPRRELLRLVTLGGVRGPAPVPG
jgi:hypothetical protein